MSTPIWEVAKAESTLLPSLRVYRPSIPHSTPSRSAPPHRHHHGHPTQLIMSRPYPPLTAFTTHHRLKVASCPLCVHANARR